MTSKFPTERVTKLDAARRQLRTAIRLFFADGDSISVHALAAAAHELLRGLLKPKGGGSLIKDNDWIRPEGLREYLAIMNSPQNFFKHADRDPDEVLDFTSTITEVWILDCIAMYQKLTGRMLREYFVFTIWFGQQHPELLKSGLFAEQMQKLKETAPMTKSRCLLLIERADLWPLPNLD